MSAATDLADPHRLGRGVRVATGHGEGGPAEKRVVVAYGFWIFLLSDIVMFSALFAAYAVLRRNTAGGPGGADLFNITNVEIETACLLASSFACGIASVGAAAHNHLMFYGALVVTFLLGVAFVALEAHEFAGLVARGDGPGRSGFLTSFFTVVGCHGLHVSCGLLWLLTMMAQVFAKGFRADILRRFQCFSLFWHALDIIWVALFTVVYLLGAGA
jgi:cytochrome o ubiquinol oxidase subunit III